MNELVVFLGPSLPARAARRVARCRVLPPARQGDVWRALALAPRAIALVDGLFEAAPSVWHRELLAALEAGVPVVGASSMGALRAAELASSGMRGCGRVFGWARRGELDDADVALLHAGAEDAFRPLTLPFVDARYAAERAVGERVLRASEGRELVAAARAIFYQERTWPAVFARLRWPEERRASALAFVRGVPSVKALDAREAIALAARLAPTRPDARAPAPSSLVRRRRLAGPALEALRARPDAALLAEHGLRRLLLAARARELGLAPTSRERAAAERAWLGGLGVTDERAFFAASGIDAGEAERIAEVLALERLALDHAARLTADGPSADEGLALEARLAGLWAGAERGASGAGRARARPASRRRRTARG